MPARGGQASFAGPKINPTRQTPATVHTITRNLSLASGRLIFQPAVRFLLRCAAANQHSQIIEKPWIRFFGASRILNHDPRDAQTN
jgi:hypothetical protein